MADGEPTDREPDESAHRARVAVAGRWWSLAAIAASMLAVGLDLTILNVALPTIAVDLGASTSELQWFVAVYLLVLAAGVLPAGVLGDRLGQKRLFLGALALFGAASVACAYAGSPATLIVARVLLGAGAAFLIPLSISLLVVLFAPEERPKAIAMWTMAVVVGIPIGPVLGGWLVDQFWWGSVFLVSVPPVLAAFVVLARLLPPTPGTARERVDAVGMVLSGTGLVALTYGLIGLGHRGVSPAALAPVAAGLGLLALFGYWLRRTPHPLFDPRMFRSAGFTVGALLTTVGSFALIGAMFVLPQFIQAVWGADPLEVGLRVLPVVGGLLVGVQAGERLHKALGVRALIVAGYGLMTVGLLIGATTRLGAGYPFVATWMAVMGLGLGLALPLALNVALGGIADDRSGTGAGVLQTMRQVGGTLGVAVLGATLNARYRGEVDTTGLPAPDADAVLGTAASGVAVARTTGSADLLESVRMAFLGGMSAMLLVCAAVTAFGAVLALVSLPPKAADVPDRQLADDVRPA